MYDDRKCSISNNEYSYQLKLKNAILRSLWKRNTALLASMYGAGEENRTHDISLEG